jgi:hypothetical protein
MSTTLPDVFVRVGMNPEQARLVGALIDAPGTANANALKLIGMGFSAPLADELGSQMAGGTGDTTRMAGLGVPHALADAIKAAIDAP